MAFSTGLCSQQAATIGLSYCSSKFCIVKDASNAFLNLTIYSVFFAIFNEFLQSFLVRPGPSAISGCVWGLWDCSRPPMILVWSRTSLDHSRLHLVTPDQGEYTCCWTTHTYICIEKPTPRCPDNYLKASVIHLTSQQTKVSPSLQGNTCGQHCHPWPPECSQLHLVALDSLKHATGPPITWFTNTMVGKPLLDYSRLIIDNY